MSWLPGVIKADMDTDIHSLSTLLRAFPEGMSYNNRSMSYCLCTHFTDEEINAQKNEVTAQITYISLTDFPVKLRVLMNRLSQSWPLFYRDT